MGLAIRVQCCGRWRHLLLPSILTTTSARLLSSETYLISYARILIPLTVTPLISRLFVK